MQAFGVKLEPMLQNGAIMGDNSEQVGLNIPPDESGFIFNAYYSPHCINTNVGPNVLMKRLVFVVILTLLTLDSLASKDPWDKDQSKWTPLMKLAHSNDTIKIKELIRSGISINLQNKDGWTALKVASKKGLTKTVDFLLRNGADTNLADKDKMTPLMEAALHNEKEIAKLLIKRGADPNRKNKTGWTALMGATSFADLEMMKLLVDNGADINVKRKVDGNTALELARLNNEKEKIDFLLKSGAK